MHEDSTAVPKGNALINHEINTREEAAQPQWLQL